MTRYEKGDRNPKIDRTNDIAKILNVSINSIRDYDFKDETDLYYLFLRLEELLPNIEIKFNKLKKIDNNFIKFIEDWNQMKIKKQNKMITWEEYIEWKVTYKIRGNK